MSVEAIKAAYYDGILSFWDVVRRLVYDHGFTKAQIREAFPEEYADA
jgi:hypothetical protein